MLTLNSIVYTKRPAISMGYREMQDKGILQKSALSAGVLKGEAAKSKLGEEISRVGFRAGGELKNSPIFADDHKIVDGL